MKQALENLVDPLTGTGDAPTRLDEIQAEDLAALTDARRRDDERLVEFVEGLTDGQFDAAIEYRMFNGSTQRQILREVLAHLNHQTHHRGQAHAILTTLGVKEPDSLDVLWMLRERAQHVRG